MAKKAPRNYGSIRPRDRVKFYKQNLDGSATRMVGWVVMKGPHGWVVNAGGPNGTPEIVSEENFAGFGGRVNG